LREHREFLRELGGKDRIDLFCTLKRLFRPLKVRDGEEDRGV